MSYVNVSMKCIIGKSLVDWALTAYRKHQKTYAKDVKREIAGLWTLKGGELCFEDHDVSIALVGTDNGVFLEEVYWDKYRDEWTSPCSYVIHAVWRGTKEERASLNGTLLPVWLEIA